MRGKKAKEIWNAVVGNDASRRNRKYYRVKKTGQIVADGLRRAYQYAKKAVTA